MATHSSFLPGESHGQRSLVGYSPWGCKESDMPEHACTHHMGTLEASKPFLVLPESDLPMGTATLVSHCA